MSITFFLAKKLTNYQSDSSFAFKLRQKRSERIISLINECYIKYNHVKIIDIGGTKTYWDIIPREILLKKNVHITIVNLPSSEQSLSNDELFSFIEGDGCNLIDFEDKAFHISHSNSVIEHVGGWENIVRFSRETQRVSEKFYLQTPNFYFPLEPHFMTPFFHWLPKSLRIKLVMNFRLGWFNKASNYNQAKATVDEINLLSKDELIKLFPKAAFYPERIGPFIKSLVLIGS